MLAAVLAAGTGCTGALGVGEGDHDGGGPTGRDGAPVQPSDAAGAMPHDGGPKGDGGPDGGRDDRDAGSNDAGVEPHVDAGPCTGSSLSDALTVTPVEGTGSSRALYAAPTSVGGAVIAWGGNPVHLTHVDGLGRRVGVDVTVEGNRPWGVAVADERGEPTWSVLLDRGSDVLALVGVGPSGTVRFDRTLIGDVPHDVTGNEWFGSGIRAARLDWTGSRWVAYYTVQRLWDDGLAHYGDQLRFFARDGSPDGLGWGWGCSHSMDVRLSHNDSRLGPVCLSDCYPSKGVHFDHRAFLYPDQDGSNCAGGYGTGLGASVPVSDGFWVAFTAIDGRPDADAALVHVGNDESTGEPVWLTEGGGPERSLNAERYGPSELVVGWVNGGENRLVRVDASSGGPVGPPETVADAALSGASDFILLHGGDVGWAVELGAGVGFARLQVCP